MNKENKAPEPKAKPYANLGKLSKIVRILLVLCIVLGAARVCLAFVSSSFIENIQAGVPMPTVQAEKLDTMESAAAIAGSAAFLVTGISFLIWTIRSRSNLTALGVKELAFTDVDAAGAFMVPLYNLFQPYKAMQETWKASDPSVLDPLLWKHQGPSRLVRCWGISWVLINVGAVVNNYSGLELHSHPNLAQIHAYYQSTQLYEIAYIAAAILAIIMVGNITTRQQEKFAKVAPTLEV